MENKKSLFAEASDGEIKKLADNSDQETRKTPQSMQDRSTCVGLEKLSKDYKINKSLPGLLVYRMIMPSAERLSEK